MTIPAAHREKSLYHFTHIDNAIQIINSNEIYAKYRLENYHDIAANEIQERRAAMQVPCGPRGTVHNYVPFYFCKRSPMLYAIKTRGTSEQNIVYFEYPITILENENGVFTDSSANRCVPPVFYTDTTDLDNLDWDAIDTWRWGNQHDTDENILPIRQRKMAEALIHHGISLEYCTQIIVWGETQKNIITTELNKNNINIPVLHTIHDVNSYYIDQR